jgi:hypothetical protein
MNMVLSPLLLLAGGVSASRVLTVDPLRLSLAEARDTVRAHLAAGSDEPVAVELLPGTLAAVDGGVIQPPLSVLQSIVSFHTPYIKRRLNDYAVHG